MHVATIPDPWRAIASRATHPSVRQVDDDLLTAIARGLAAAAVPTAVRDAGAAARSSADPGGEPLLATGVYDAWLVDLPAGRRTPVRRLDAELAIAVAGGVLEVELHSAGQTALRRITDGGVLEVPSGWRFRAATPEGPATLVVVSSPPQLTSPADHVLGHEPTPAAVAGTP